MPRLNAAERAQRAQRQADEIARKEMEERIAVTRDRLAKRVCTAVLFFIALMVFVPFFSWRLLPVVTPRQLDPTVAWALGPYPSRNTTLEQKATALTRYMVLTTCVEYAKCSEARFRVLPYVRDMAVVDRSVLQLEPFRPKDYSVDDSLCKSINCIMFTTTTQLVRDGQQMLNMLVYNADMMDAVLADHGETMPGSGIVFALVAVSVFFGVVYRLVRVLRVEDTRWTPVLTLVAYIIAMDYGQESLPAVPDVVAALLDEASTFVRTHELMTTAFTVGLLMAAYKAKDYVVLLIRTFHVLLLAVVVLLLPALCAVYEHTRFGNPAQDLNAAGEVLRFEYWLRLGFAPRIAAEALLAYATTMPYLCILAGSLLATWAITDTGTMYGFVLAAVVFAQWGSESAPSDRFSTKLMGYFVSPFSRWVTIGFVGWFLFVCLALYLYASMRLRRGRLTTPPAIGVNDHNH